MYDTTDPVVVRKNNSRNELSRLSSEKCIQVSLFFFFLFLSFLSFFLSDGKVKLFMVLKYTGSYGLHRCVDHVSIKSLFL